MYDSSMTSSFCCPRHPQETATSTSTTTTTRHDEQLSSPGHNHLTKALTNFSIESIIGGRGPPAPRSHDVKLETRDGHDAQAASMNHSSQPQKKFRPKNFACPVCRMAFSNNGQLKNHVRIHTGERPFACNQVGCNKTFTRNEELTRHKLIHTGVRPHACPNCCKSFGRKDHLKKHVRTHERKRMRKRVYVLVKPVRPTAKTSVSGDGVPGKIMMEPDYSHPKRVCSKPDGRTHFKNDTATSSLPPATNVAVQFPRTDAVLPLPITGVPAIEGFIQSKGTFIPPSPVTLAQNFNHLIDSDPTKAMTSFAVTRNLWHPPVSMAAAASTGAALQQLAGDYWHKWYSFMELCHQQHQQQQQQIIPSSRRM